MTTFDYQLYGWNTPNGQKIVIALEEMGAKYEYHPINILEGEQHAQSFKAISPDGKIPALIHNKKEPVTLFESGAILLYLANQYPELHGKTHAAKEPNPAAVEHFEALVWRCLTVLEKRLSESRYLASDHFTVADIASFPWIASQQSYLQRYEVDWRGQCPSVARWASAIESRESARKALGLS